MNRAPVLFAALFSLSLLAGTADARRLGGGASFGKQRSTITQPAPTPSAPQAPAAAPANPAPQPSGASRWLGPLAGLAIGAGLASLFMGNGFSGALGGIVMIMLLVAGAMFVLRMLRSRPQTPPLQYAGTETPLAQPGVSSNFGGGAGVPNTANRYPPGFDPEQFLHHAKLNFTQLQAANDKGDLATLRDFMTPALYAEIAAEISAQGSVPQQTDVVTLNADVLEVVTEGDLYVASVRFNGMIRERADGAAEPFSEIWHLEKPVDGKTGWLIAGIQQN